jgi:hypothetical protein
MVARQYAGNNVSGIQVFVIHVSPPLQRITNLIEIAAPSIVVQHHVHLVLTQPSVELLLGLDCVFHDDSNDDDDVVSWKNSISNCGLPRIL